jgi:hypothetical protein
MARRTSIPCVVSTSGLPIPKRSSNRLMMRLLALNIQSRLVSVRLSLTSTRLSTLIYSNDQPSEGVSLRLSSACGDGMHRSKLASLIVDASRSTTWKQHQPTDFV